MIILQYNIVLIICIIHEYLTNKIILFFSIVKKFNSNVLSKNKCYKNVCFLPVTVFELIDIVSVSEFG